jgi:hypothetical protein
MYPSLYQGPDKSFTYTLKKCDNLKMEVVSDNLVQFVCTECYNCVVTICGITCTDQATEKVSMNHEIMHEA